MIVDTAQRRRCADALARVDALVVLACLVARALGVRDALGSAAGVGVSVEVGQARADSQTVVLAALRVRSAGARVADGLGWCRSR